MTLYLDDDSNDAVLVASLRKAGHDVVFPAERGMIGRRDPEHFLKCVQERRVMFTGNYKDFVPLHQLVIGCAGTHLGVVVIRRDNDSRKDMKHKEIVSAIGKVEQAYSDLRNELVTLNDWR